MNYRLGVDLGTTFTAAAVDDGTGPKILGLGNRALQVPSVLFAQDTGEFLCGEAAERRAVSDPGRAIREFKRRIGDPVPILVDGRPYSPQSLTARLLSWVIAMATEREGSPPDQVTLTHPANWGGYKRELFQQVAALADVPEARLCTEPEAAAANYAARERLQAGSNLVIYDLGGGTFDVCVVTLTEKGPHVLGTPEGVEHLGGIDFDKAVLAHVVSTLADQIQQLDPEEPVVLARLATLRRDCVEAKEALSHDVDTVVPVSLPGLNTSVRLTRTELEELVRPSLEETVRATRRALRSAGLSSAEVQAVVLVGGSSRIPLVTEMLQASLETRVAIDTHPKHDVAAGALLTPPVDAPSPVPSRAPSALRSRDLERPLAPDSNTPPARVKRQWTRPALWAFVGATAIAATTVAAMEINVGGGSTAGSPAVPSTDSSPSSTAPTPPFPVSRPLSDEVIVVSLASTTGSGSDLYLANQQSREAPTALPRGRGDRFGPVISKDRRSIVFGRDSNGRQSLWVMAADGTHERPLFNSVPAQCETSISRPAWSPTTPTLFAVACTDAKGKSGLYVIDSVSAEIVAVLPTKVRSAAGGLTALERIDDPAFSRDGAQVAFYGSLTDKLDGGSIYIVAAVSESEEPIALTSSDAGVDADPDWSPDGKRIAFRRIVNGNREIFDIAVRDKSNLHQLTQTPADDQDPTWSPLGDKIAFKSNRRNVQGQVGGRSRVWAMDRNGAKPRVLWTATTGEVLGAPAWKRK